MQDSPPLCIVDANILIDLHVGGLLQELFRLPFRLAAPDVIIAELDEPDGEALVEYGLESIELVGEQVLEVAELLSRYRSVSTSDLFALVLARTHKATLLTGDRHLTEMATQEGVAVHGILWVLDEMVRLGVVSPVQAAQALRQMLKQGSRLPQTECQKRLRRWRTR
jgi:predicted nucleic acid-binding protein